MKSLYNFEVEHDGKKYQFMIAKPTRRQVEEAEIEYAAEYSRCIRKDILPKEILRNKYEESGGLMSKEAAKNLNKKYLKLNELTTEITKLNSGKVSKANKAKVDKLQEEFTELRREISQIETDNSGAFNNTADVKAQNKALVWYSVNLTMIKNEKDQWEPYFKGDDFEEKEDFYYEKEDSEDMVYFKSIGLIGAIISVWQYNKTMGEEQIKNILEEFDIVKKPEDVKDTNVDDSKEIEKDDAAKEDVDE